MDIFEYAVITISFEVIEKNGRYEPGEAKVIVNIHTYDSDGKSPGVEKCQEYPIEEQVYADLHQYHVQRGDSSFKYIVGKLEPWVNRNFPILTISPYLAMLGKKGWEIVEYKSASFPAIGQALLKRKMKKSNKK